MLRAADVRCSQSLGVDTAYALVENDTVILKADEQTVEIEDEDTELESLEIEVTQ